jgi:integrase
MMPAPSMQSLVQEYLDERRRLGFALQIAGAQLMAFARFADRSGHSGPLTSEIILAWAQGQATCATPITWARRLEIVRPFAKYRARIDVGTEILATDIFGRAHRRLTPHIYTETEITDLMAAAGQLHPHGTLRPATYEALFGLIAATGLRISEALHLQCADVDLDGGCLTVRQTKFRKSRFLPLHPTVTEALARYSVVRQHYIASGSDDCFFVSPSGAGLSDRTVQGVFQQLRAALGWTARGNHPAPRIHDLRHTFICRRVMLWHEQGADIDHAMLALTTYVGHVKVSDTYWYLSAVPELMAVAGQRFEQFASNPGDKDHG